MKNISIRDDLKTLNGLIDKGKLGDAVGNLKASDVLGSLKRSSPAVVRLLLGLRPIPNIEARLEEVDPAQREPARALLAAAKGSEIAQFLEKVDTAIAEDGDVRRILGFDITDVPKKVASAEAKIRSTVTGFAATPQLMLRSKRLYVEVAYLQGDSLLFRSNEEIDDVLQMGCSLVESAAGAFDCLEKNAKMVSPQIEFERCYHHLKSLRSAILKTEKSLKRLQPRKPVPPQK
jgi:hypothetical protein